MTDETPRSVMDILIGLAVKRERLLRERVLDAMRRLDPDISRSGKKN